ncbi:hypothetical protein GJ744_009980 [Endocarpon pusillum]|uniref:Uncharacterized protein n=1 Tax=Endocarpon pusillum TaxID=364733 RepID=A0A8H7AIX4_9EURO|nr:hypothetical protein GJ744_009980 [Endocarpon pusillum]
MGSVRCVSDHWGSNNPQIRKGTLSHEDEFFNDSVGNKTDSAPNAEVSFLRSDLNSAGTVPYHCPSPSCAEVQLHGDRVGELARGRGLRLISA